MKKVDENIDFIETLIGACGSAISFSELACEVKKMANYFNDDDLHNFYDTLLVKIFMYAGISDEFSNIEIDLAIERFKKE